MIRDLPLGACLRLVGGSFTSLGLRCRCHLHRRIHGGIRGLHGHGPWHPIVTSAGAAPCSFSESEPFRSLYATQKLPFSLDTLQIYTKNCSFGGCSWGDQSKTVPAPKDLCQSPGWASSVKATSRGALIPKCNGRPSGLTCKSFRSFRSRSDLT